MLRFEAHQPTPPSSFPPASESSFVMCHASKLTNPLLPLPPLQLVSPHLCRATLRSSPTRSPPVLRLFSHFRPSDLEPSSSSSSPPPPSESSFLFCRVPSFNYLLPPLPPLQLVSPRLCHALFRSSPTRSSLFLPSSW